MRVVSQNGMIDVPYELTAIHATKNAIKINMAGETGNGSILATYSTEVKTAKAMEMLREMYCRVKAFHSVCAGCFDSFGEGLNSGNKELPILFENLLSMSVFKFPKDEEIEVEDET